MTNDQQMDTDNPNFRAMPEHLLSGSKNGENTNYSTALPNLLRRDALDPGILLDYDSDNPNSEIHTNRVHYFNLDELIGKTFLRERDVDGTIHFSQSFHDL